MAYLFDTDALSEPRRPRPALAYVRWLRNVPRAEQFTSAVVIGELFRGAFRSPRHADYVDDIERRVLRAVTVLPYGAESARAYGRLAAELEAEGRRLADADLQIAATALVHDLDLVTGNVRHFRRIPGLRVNPVLAEARP